MFLTFFGALREAGLPVSLQEYLMLLAALDKGVAQSSAEEFYVLARTALVKDERNLDCFDQVFGRVFKGLEADAGGPDGTIPEDWIRKLIEKSLSEEEKQRIQALGGFDAIMAALRERLAEQRGRHQGGSKWVGTGGTSPFGNAGYNPAGVRIGQDGNRNHSAVKVWERREFRDLDGTRELGTRTIKLALRRLRKFAREGSAQELDLSGTIGATARQGWLDVRLVPERRNSVKVLIFFDVGGSMDPHVRVCEELFSAARAAFRHMQYFYFHNCIYEAVWSDNRRRDGTRLSTWQVLNTYGPGYKVIFVGDGAMSPFELTEPGGSVEHWNEEPGLSWLQRVTAAYPDVVWLNPSPEQYWNHSPSISLISRSIDKRMFPLTLDGIDRAMRELMR